MSDSTACSRAHHMSRNTIRKRLASSLSTTSRHSTHNAANARRRMWSSGSAASCKARVTTDKCHSASTDLTPMTANTTASDKYRLRRITCFCNCMSDAAISLIAGLSAHIATAYFHDIRTRVMRTSRPRSAGMSRMPPFAILCFHIPMRFRTCFKCSTTDCLPPSACT